MYELVEYLLPNILLDITQTTLGEKHAWLCLYFLSTLFYIYSLIMSFVDDNTPVTVVQMEENDIDFNLPMGETDIALPDGSTGDNSYPDPLHSQFGSEDDSNHNDNGEIYVLIVPIYQYFNTGIT